MSIWEPWMDTLYPDHYQDKPLYVLFKSKKHDSFKIAEMIWSDVDSIGVKEYFGFGILSHDIKHDDVFMQSTDIGELNKILQNYERMIKFEEKKFGCVKILLDI